MTVLDPERFTEAEQQRVRATCEGLLQREGHRVGEALAALDVARFAHVVLFAPRVERSLEISVFGHRTVAGQPTSEWLGYLFADSVWSAPWGCAWDALEDRIGELQSGWMAAYLEKPEDPALLSMASEPLRFRALESWAVAAVFETISWGHEPPATLHIGERTLVVQSD